MAITTRQNLRNIRSVVLGKTPTTDQLDFGEIAVNYNAKNPFLAFKVSGESGTDIVTLKGETGDDNDYSSQVLFDSAITYDDETIVSENDNLNTAMGNIFKVVIDNEKVAAQALTYLNSNLIKSVRFDENVSGESPYIENTELVIPASSGVRTSKGGLVSLAPNTGLGYIVATSNPAGGWESPFYMDTNIMISGSAIYSTNGYLQSSDERLKNFKEDIPVDLDKLSKLPKKYYNWKNDTTNEGTQIGTSAQKLQELYPELVKTSPEGTLVVDYPKLSIVALAAIDKLYQRIQDLEKRLNKEQ